MREIKFRIWHKVRRKMFPVTGLEWGPKGLVYILYPHTGAFGNSYRVEPFAAELIQYTGLHDKDGVEIYEGDIISYDWIYNDPDWTYGAGNEPKEVVRWNDKRTGYSPITDQDQFYTIKNIQIQGNIYQNPELLEDTP